MQPEPYAQKRFMFYPGMNLSQAERDRMDRYEVPIDEVTIDHLVYAMSKQIENNFQAFYTVAEELVGEELALKIAFEIGKRYGGGGYAKLLEAHGLGRNGSARMMTIYQDLVHAIRGPKHTAALFAEYNDDRCVVKRNACIYYNEANPQNGKYTGAFEQGCFEGYKAADQNLREVVVHSCVWRQEDRCEISWEYGRAQP